MARFNKKDPLRPPEAPQRVVVYIEPDDYKSLQVKLIQETGHRNVSGWVREQIKRFLSQ